MNRVITALLIIITCTKMYSQSIFLSTGVTANSTQWEVSNSNGPLYENGYVGEKPGFRINLGYVHPINSRFNWFSSFGYMKRNDPVIIQGNEFFGDCLGYEKNCSYWTLEGGYPTQEYLQLDVFNLETGIEGKLTTGKKSFISLTSAMRLDHVLYNEQLERLKEKEALNSFILGVNLGLGYFRKYNFGEIGIRAEYQAPLTPLAKWEKEYSGVIRLQSYSAFVEARFNLKQP